ncbi:hypothetical protein [Enterococcus termitis]|uniref:Uncharacterized protein n=1 Tax=Enterococcus termitis TaxID=332950 RepID=A0A1E5GU16_9ENTE|nr:hypothetical protein [Enterococcus termitis]OEG16183.1 hypothetical protein BCR25_18485 [Enterococcus termitis]OJG96796.1 hypothetical protein RV18_GL001842 [Enterococcus termitis]
MKFDLKNLKLFPSVKQLISLVENHIGSNEKEAHKAASEFTHGFATPEVFKGAWNIRLRGALKQYKSVFDIPAGLYETYADFGDLPDELSNSSNIIQLRIERGLGDRKQIWLTEGYNGTLWYYTMHTTAASYNPEGWTRIPRIEVVWTGTAKDAGNIITFNQQMTHFKTIRVWVELDDGVSWICQEFESNKSFNVRYFDIFNGTSIGGNFFEIGVTRNSASQMTIARNRGLGIDGKDTASNMRIRKIEGVA